MKILRVGDYHVQVSKLKDCERLLEFILKIAKKEKVDKIELMGDTFHNHAIKRIEVDYFVKDMLFKLSRDYEVVVLIGNHDLILGKSQHAGKHALEPFKNVFERVTIVDSPQVIDGIGYIPYMSDTRELSKATDELFKLGAKKTLVGHLTVDGAKYENGFYSEEGIPMDLIAQEHIISGHVHKQGDIGKCFYVGTPKWDTMSSAGQEKGIWVFNHNKNGSVKGKKFYSTEEVVTPIYKVVINEEDGESVTISEKGVTYLTAKGSSSWIKKMKKKYLGAVHFKGIPTDKRKQRFKIDVKNNTFTSYIDSYFKPTKGVKKEDIIEYIKEISNG